jgi:hypothetical protein
VVTHVGEERLEGEIPKALRRGLFATKRRGERRPLALRDVENVFSLPGSIVHVLEAVRGKKWGRKFEGRKFDFQSAVK